MAADVPEEIRTEILAKLCVKSLVRFKLVCKSWKSLISCPYFIDRHHDGSTVKGSKLAIFLKHNSKPFFHTLDFSPVSPGETKMIEIPKKNTIFQYPKQVRGKPIYGEPLSCCRGLLLLVVRCWSDSELLLWNPSTREYKHVPNPPYPHNYGTITASSALGYDFSVRSHKIVIVTRFSKRYSSYRMAVYDLKENLWTSIDLDKHHTRARYKNPVTVNGVPHWMRMRNKEDSAVEYLDFSTNKLVVVPQPRNFSTRPKLFDMEGHLCMVYVNEEEEWKREIWVMMKHGVKESWSRWMTFDDSIFPIRDPICFANHNVSLVDEGRGCFAIYNGKDRGYELKFQAGIKHKYRNRAFAFTESLISLGSKTGFEEIEEVRQEKCPERVRQEERPNTGFGMRGY